MMLPDKRKGADEMKIQTVFERTEKKYIITLGQREKLLQIINQYIKPDEYGESTVCSLYFDTPDYRMIRQSMEKPEAQAQELFYSQGGQQRVFGAEKEIQRSGV